MALTSLKLVSSLGLACLLTLAGAACDDPVGANGDGDELDPTFSQLAVLEAPQRTRSLAVTGSGRWLVVLNGQTATEGDSLYVYDLATHAQARPPLFVDGASAVAMSAGGQMAVLVGEGLFETIGYSLPDLTEVFRAEARSGRQIVRKSDGSVYFIASSFGVSRVTSDGEVLPDTLGLQSVAALALSPDEGTLLAVTTFPGGRQLHALSATDLLRRAIVPLSFTASVLVPLADHGEVLVLGTTAERPFRGPIVGAVVNWANGSVGPPMQIATGNEIVYFGTADPWIRIAPDLVLVVSSYGVIEVSPVTGGVRLLEGPVFEGGYPCCAIAFDEARGHVLAARRRVNFEVGGPVVIFERVR